MARKLDEQSLTELNKATMRWFAWRNLTDPKWDSVDLATQAVALALEERIVHVRACLNGDDIAHIEKFYIVGAEPQPAMQPTVSRYTIERYFDIYGFGILDEDVMPFENIKDAIMQCAFWHCTGVDEVMREIDNEMLDEIERTLCEK